MGKCAYIISDINGKNPKGNQYMEDFRDHIDQRAIGGYNALFIRLIANEWSSFVDFFIFIYITMLSFSIISGKMTLTSAVMCAASGFIWGFAGERKAVKGCPSGRRSW